MTDNEIRIAIAECCGWKPTEMQAAGMLAGVPFWTDGEKFCPAEHLPDYPNSLDVMHEAEAVLNENQQYEYCENIAGISAKNYHRFLFRLTNATARTKAEAFLRTIGKWKE